MAIVAWLETILPLHVGARASRSHLLPNLALTFLAFGTNVFLNAAVVWTLMLLPALHFGVLNQFSLPPFAALVVTLLVLDFSFYVAHVAMHKIPAFWRFHLVHHCDPSVDVTTTIRQHPGEGVIRYVFMAGFAFALGAGPVAFAVYRAASALSGLLEHANLRFPLWADRLLSIVTTWPHMHKVHHSRRPQETDSNYGNLFSFWDRIFSTFTPSSRGTDIHYGIEGLDDPHTQTTRGLLWLPFRRVGQCRSLLHQELLAEFSGRARSSTASLPMRAVGSGSRGSFWDTADAKSAETAVAMLRA
jgi:sterol desaturase/sphingolipid hydroxylase (fatty acid hydroxylase superfamily)